MPLALSGITPLSRPPPSASAHSAFRGTLSNTGLHLFYPFLCSTPIPRLPQRKQQRDPWKPVFCPSNFSRTGLGAFSSSSCHPFDCFTTGSHLLPQIFSNDHVAQSLKRLCFQENCDLPNWSHETTGVKILTGKPPRDRSPSIPSGKTSYRIPYAKTSVSPEESCSKQILLSIPGSKNPEPIRLRIRENRLQLPGMVFSAGSLEESSARARGTPPLRRSGMPLSPIQDPPRRVAPPPGSPEDPSPDPHLNSKGSR